MQRPMRRKDRLMPENDAMELLGVGEYGVLSTVGEDNAPYGLPISYVLLDRTIYIHCAKQGHKIDNMKQEAQVSFCVVTDTQPIHPVGNFTTKFKSVIAAGNAREVTDEAEKRDAIYKLTVKYFPQDGDDALAEIDKHINHFSMWAIDLTSVSGKQNI